MKIIPIFNGEIANNKLTLTDEEFIRYRKFLLGRQGKYHLYLKRPLKRKNRKFENYYWSVVLPMIADSTGEQDLLKLHAVFKSMFLKRMIDLKSHQRINFYELVGRTHGMTSVQYGRFVENVRQYAAAELGIIIPDPDPKHNLPILIEND